MPAHSPHSLVYRSVTSVRKQNPSDILKIAIVFTPSQPFGNGFVSSRNIFNLPILHSHFIQPSQKLI